MSKQRDYAITQEVLRAYGDAVKDSMKRVLRAVEAAREDGLSIDVSGMDEFDIGDFGTELDDAQRLLSLGIDSPTSKKQVYKKLAFQFLVRRAARSEGPDRARDRSRSNDGQRRIVPQSFRRDMEEQKRMGPSCVP